MGSTPSSGEVTAWHSSALPTMVKYLPQPGSAVSFSCILLGGNCSYQKRPKVHGTFMVLRLIYVHKEGFEARSSIHRSLCLPGTIFLSTGPWAGDLTGKCRGRSPISSTFLFVGRIAGEVQRKEFQRWPSAGRGIHHCGSHLLPHLAFGLCSFKELGIQ